MIKVHLGRLSRTISHALRHAPWLYELELDDEGWVSVEALLDALRRHRRDWRRLTRDDLTRMMEASSKRRFELAPDRAGGGRIRALYGHSLPGKLQRTPAAPPDVLFHGTAPDVFGEIEAEGLKPMSRQYVHLSVDKPTALEVGRRKAPRPVILTIRAADAHGDGIAFYQGNEHVWLADHVPPRYIRFET